mmetsp:Transcript_8926/g.25708  ORF Transcript_8926/g.25708 Transcript_8926/m.25708 type:complete len:289 (+) Transcript_8926:502-1368(+)
MHQSLSIACTHCSQICNAISVVFSQSSAQPGGAGPSLKRSADTYPDTSIAHGHTRTATRMPRQLTTHSRTSTYHTPNPSVSRSLQSVAGSCRAPRLWMCADRITSAHDGPIVKTSFWSPSCSSRSCCWTTDCGRDGQHPVWVACLCVEDRGQDCPMGCDLSVGWVAAAGESGTAQGTVSAVVAATSPSAWVATGPDPSRPAPSPARGLDLPAARGPSPHPSCPPSQHHGPWSYWATHLCHPPWCPLPSVWSRSHWWTPRAPVAAVACWMAGAPWRRHVWGTSGRRAAG